jgi:squalene-hopene/tetraprenyl-beta-curcumene cyclase
MGKVSYWSRTVIAPLLILFNKKPVKVLPESYCIRELFLTPPEKITRLDYATNRFSLKNLFILLDIALKRLDPYFPKSIRQKAFAQTLAWTKERMVGSGGLGAIFPAMANSLMMLHVLGYADDCEETKRALQSIDELVTTIDGETFCQPCVGHIWDTCLSLNAILEAGVSAQSVSVTQSVEWLMSKQVLDVQGDWQEKIPDVAPGGWYFQLENAFYPDVDDTAMVLMSLFRAGIHYDPKWLEQIEIAVNWILGMQNSDGSWAAFDVDNNRLYLNNIPFADHGALLDPGTSDVTARCIEMLAMLGYGEDYPPIDRALKFLLREQERSGAWYGRWGVNYVYGTWSVLAAFGALGYDSSYKPCQAAVRWLKTMQNQDGGWGESCASYQDPSLAAKGESMPSVTSWALLGLMAVGEVNCGAVENGVNYLISNFNGKGYWNDELFNGTGFPRVFYLRYTGYNHFFPLWALSIYRRLKLGRKTSQQKARPNKPFRLNLKAKFAS